MPDHFVNITEMVGIGSGATAWPRLLAERLGAAAPPKLSTEFGHGFSVSNLQLMRKFFVEYKFRIQQQAAVKLTAATFQQQHAVEFSPVVIAKPSQKPPFTLSWPNSGNRLRRRSA